MLHRSDEEGGEEGGREGGREEAVFLTYVEGRDVFRNVVIYECDANRVETGSSKPIESLSQQQNVQEVLQMCLTLTVI